MELPDLFGESDRLTHVTCKSRLFRLIDISSKVDVCNVMADDSSCLPGITYIYDKVKSNKM